MGTDKELWYPARDVVRSLMERVDKLEMICEKLSDRISDLEIANGVHNRKLGLGSKGSGE
jgi:hypothetical protein